MKFRRSITQYGSEVFFATLKLSGVVILILMIKSSQYQVKDWDSPVRKHIRFKPAACKIIIMGDYGDQQSLLAATIKHCFYQKLKNTNCFFFFLSSGQIKMSVLIKLGIIICFSFRYETPFWCRWIVPHSYVPYDTACAGLDSSAAWELDEGSWASADVLCKPAPPFYLTLARAGKHNPQSQWKKQLRLVGCFFSFFSLSFIRFFPLLSFTALKW